MLVGGGRQFVHQAARQSAQAVQVRQQVRVQRGRQVAPGQRRGVRIGAEQVQAARVRDGRGGGAGGGDGGLGGGIHGGILRKRGVSGMVR